MNTKTTLDYRSLLANWRDFQKNKFMLRNMYTCTASLQNIMYINQAILTFVNEENRMEMRNSSVSYNLSFNVSLNQISGYNSEANTISITLREMPNPLILVFPNEEIQGLAFSALEYFTREIAAELAPPSSSDSD